MVGHADYQIPPLGNYTYLTQSPSGLHNPLICLLLEEGQLRIDRNTEGEIRQTACAVSLKWERAVTTATVCMDMQSQQNFYNILRSQLRDLDRAASNQPP